MDRMLTVVFDNESKAYEGKKALLQLDGEGSIIVYAYAVITKNADGTSTIKQGDDPGPIGTFVGTSVRSLIGLLGGPAGLAIGATAGVAAGSIFDVHNARIADDYLDDVKKALTANKVAVVASWTKTRRRPSTHGWSRWEGRCFGGPCRTSGHGQPGGAHRDEGRSPAVQGGAGEGASGPAGEDPGEDHQPRVQDSGSSPEGPGRSPGKERQAQTKASV